MIPGNGADGAADVDDFGGSEIGRKRGDDTAARHGNLDVTEIQKRMTTEIDAVGLRRRDTLRRHEAVALQLICELLERRRLEAGEDERRFDELERGAEGQPGPRGCFAGKPELLNG